MPSIWQVKSLTYQEGYLNGLPLEGIEFYRIICEMHGFSLSKIDRKVVDHPRYSKQ